MNQILVTEDEKGTSAVEIKPIVKFFAIVIIVFALILIFEGGYNLYTNSAKNNSYAKPSLDVIQNGSAINLEFKGEIGINKIEYSWNDGKTTIVKADGSKKVSFEIEIPQGNNALKVSVIDVEGNRTKFDDMNIAFPDGEDVVKPKISLVNAVGKISITATDETEISYLTYQWQDEEEVKVENKSDDNKSIVQEINVQKGTKILTVTASDKNGNKEKIVKKIVGSNGPEIKVSVADGNFIVKVTDEYAITKIEYTINGQVNNVQDIPESSKEYEFKVPLQDGVNFLKINAFENELMTEYKCKKTK